MGDGTQRQNGTWAMLMFALQPEFRVLLIETYLYITNVLPFGLNIEKMWDNKENCYRYAFICPEYFMDNKFDLFIRIDNYHPEQSLFVKTILAYGYKKNETIIHWMICDSCDYYVKKNFSEWKSMSPPQPVSKEQIDIDSYNWVTLYDKK